MPTFTATSGRKTFRDTANAADTYIIGADATRVTIAGRLTNADVINIEGLASEYTVRASGRTVTLTNGDHTVVFQLANGTNAVSVRFLDGALNAGFDGRTATLGGARLTRKASDVSDANIDATKAADGFDGGAGGGSSGGSTGSTFTLTTGVDAFQPGASAAASQTTAGNDTINGVVQGAGATGTTIQPGDFIDGGAGTDTLNITVAGAAVNGYSLSAVQTSNVERVLVSNFDTDAGATTVAADLMSGVATVGLSASGADGDTIFTGLRSIVGAEVRNGAGDLTLTYDTTAVSGTSDVQNLTVSNNTAGTFTADGIETIAIRSELVKSTLAAVASNALKTVTVTGDKDLTITAALNFASNGTATAPGAVVDASAFTGKLDISTTANEVLDIKGGSGDDTITLGSLTKNDKVDGGAGNNTVSLAAGAITDQFTGVKNVQNAVFTGATNNATVTLDASKMGSVKNVTTDIRDNTAGGGRVTVAVTNLATDQEVTVRRSTADADSFDADDGVNLTVTGRTDSENDAVKVTLSGVGTTANKLGLGTVNVAPFETVNLVSNANAAGTTKANQITDVTATETKTINITGAADLTVGTVTGTKVTSVDASKMTGKLDLTLAAMDANVRLATADSVLTLANGSLNNKDTIVGGAGADKLVVGAVTGLTSTTGVLNITGVETIELATTGDNTLNLNGVSGLKTLQVTANTQTITNMDLGATILATAAGTLDVSAKTGAGAAGTLLVEQKVGGATTTVVKSKDIGALSLTLNNTGNAAHTATFTLGEYEGSTITAAQSSDSVSTANIDLGTVHKNVRTINTSGVKGTQAANASAATAAVTFSLAGGDVATITGSGFNDTINITETGAVTHVIDAAAGTGDTVNIAVKSGFIKADSITNAEKINVTVRAGDSVDLTAGGGGTFHSSAREITIAGGNSLSTFNAGEIHTNITSVNAAGLSGKLVASFAADTLDDTITVTGGSGDKDEVTTTLGTAGGTLKAKTVGVEVLKVSAGNNATAQTFTLDLSATTGVKSVEVNNAATLAADTLVVDKITNQTVVVTGSAASGNIINAKLTDASGSADSVTIELKNAAGAIANGTILKTDDIERVNLVASGAASSVSLAQIAMTDATKFAALNITGSQALTISALNANVNTIDASGMATGGSVVQTGRSGTSAATYTGSAGNDTFIMRNGSDVLKGGAGTDTLTTNLTASLGGIVIDLSATGDQITFVNGIANTAEQSGFESVNLSSYNGSFGGDITGSTGANTIVGTANADVIDAGAGADTVTGGAGADSITLGAGADVLVFNSTTGADTINDYVVADDSIHLSKATFTALGNIGALSTGEFLAGANATAGTAAGHRIVFDTSTGDLYYDADGNANNGTAAVLIGKLTVTGTMAATEFSIVA